MSITENQSELATLQITLSQNQLQELRAKAERWGIALEDLVRATVLQLLEPEDEESKKARDYILTRDAELMRRLA